MHPALLDGCLFASRGSKGRNNTFNHASKPTRSRKRMMDVPSPTGDASFGSLSNFDVHFGIVLFCLFSGDWKSVQSSAEPVAVENAEVVIIFSKNCVVAYQWITYLTEILSKIFTSNDRPPKRYSS